LQRSVKKHTLTEKLTGHAHFFVKIALLGNHLRQKRIKWVKKIEDFKVSKNLDHVS